MSRQDPPFGGITRDGVTVPVRVDPAGLSGPTRAQSRTTRWRRSSRGLYVPTDVDGELPEQRVVEAAAVLPAYGGVTGWGALRWMGGAWFDGLAPDGATRLPVPLVTSTSDVRSQSGIYVTHERVAPEYLTMHDGLRLTTGTWALSYAMRYAASEREAVVAFDMAAYSDLVDTDEMAFMLEQQSGWTGIPRARRAMALTEENSWSPRECGMRLCWRLDAGLPRPLCNVPVFDRWGNHIGTPDLLDPEAGVVGEYDGRLHLEGTQRRRDREREAAFRRAGLEYFTVMSGDSREATARLMVETRSRAKWLGELSRDWTVELPHWWIPTFTVEQRRNLDLGQRERLLRLRRRTG